MYSRSSSDTAGPENIPTSGLIDCMFFFSFFRTRLGKKVQNPSKRNQQIATYQEETAYLVLRLFLYLFCNLQLLTCSRVAAEKKAAP